MILIDQVLRGQDLARRLERLFPDIVFFPYLREIIIIPSLRAVKHAPPRSLGLYTPFSLMGRVRSLTIFDDEIGAQRRYADQVFECLRHLPTESLESLRAVSYAESTQLYGIKRVTQCTSEAHSNLAPSTAGPFSRSLSTPTDFDP